LNQKAKNEKIAENAHKKNLYEKIHGKNYVEAFFAAFAKTLSRHQRVDSVHSRTVTTPVSAIQF